MDIVKKIITKRHEYMMDKFTDPKYLILSMDMYESLDKVIYENRLYPCASDFTSDRFRGMEILIKRRGENFIEVAG